jgi:DNA-binding MarR family transcriptional regulator
VDAYYSRSLPLGKYYTGNLHISCGGAVGRLIICRLSTRIADPHSELAPLAIDLREVIGRLIRRMRAENTFPLMQAAVLGRLDRDGPQCIGELAASESVRPQSMSQTLAELEADHLISRGPDASDGRRTRVELTRQGRALLAEYRAQREGWLAQALAEFTPAERATLSEAVDLLRRLSQRA